MSSFSYAVNEGKNCLELPSLQVLQLMNSVTKIFLSSVESSDYSVSGQVLQQSNLGVWYFVLTSEFVAYILEFGTEYSSNVLSLVLRTMKYIGYHIYFASQIRNKLE